MARLNDDAQWIVLMGFIVSFSLVFLAILLNQSTVVGQTTAESVDHPVHVDGGRTSGSTTNQWQPE